MTAALALALALVASEAPASGPVAVGSKKFTESVILGEMAVELLESAGIEARHRRELGGTRILWDALLRGDVDVYAEYTGTLRGEILSGEKVPDDAELRRALAARGIRAGRSLGFDDTYAVGMRQERADSLGIRTLSDLARHPELRLGLSHEFLDRGDGWPAIRGAYRLPQSPRGLDHDLAYRALGSGAIDATDLYSTDAEIRAHHLRVLEDDRRVFPEYQAIFLWRADLEARAPRAVQALLALQGRISAADMIDMNARAQLGGVPEARVAADFLARKLGLVAEVRAEGLGARISRRSREHLALVGVSLFAAVVLAVPLGVLAARRRRIGQVVLAAAGVVQTIPSLALLVFMIPLLGIGTRPAIAALFLYGLLPIVRNTHAGLRGIAPDLAESADALGLSAWARLRLVELPMASPAILAGIQTSAVINVGTATLGALVGAGGYGQPILAGIRLADLPLILEGAVPAALLALAVQAFFELAGRLLVPRGLRMERSG